MPTSCRIDFTGPGTGQEGGPCAIGPVQISRTQPAAISDHMSSVAWNSFCDRIDKALKPLESVNRVSRKIMYLFPLIFIIYTFVLVSNYGYWLSVVRTYFPFILGVLFLVTILERFCVANKKRRVVSDVERSCVDVSNQHSSLSFHARNIHSRDNGYTNRNSSPRLPFIEVIISDPEVGDPVTAVPLHGLSTSDTAPSPYAPGYYGVSATAVTSSSTADRLVELEGIKAIISSEEYERKRKEILDSI